MKLLIALFFLGSAQFAFAADHCFFENTIYHHGDSFMDEDLCNTCHCEIDSYGRAGVGCTEMGCLGPRPVQNFNPFKYTNHIICEKRTRAGVKWIIELEDLDRDGEFVLNARRGGVALYGRDMPNNYVVLTRYNYRGKMRFVSPRGTVFLDLTRPYDAKGTGYFSTNRFNKRVSNLTCRPF